MEGSQAWIAERREAARDRAEAGSLRPLASERTVLGVLLAIAAADGIWLVLNSARADWHPVWALLVLVGFTLAGELGSSLMDGVFVSNSFLAWILAAALLGPGPAAIVALTVSVVDTLIYGKRVSSMLKNGAILLTLAVFASVTFLVLGIQPEVGDEAQLAVAVFAVVIASAVLNVSMVAALHRVEFGMPFAPSFRTMLVPTLPFVFLSAAVAGAAAYVFVAERPAMFLGVVAILLGSELLLRSAAKSRSREKQVLALTQQRSLLLEEALEAQEAERAWLASHLHDETLQLIAAAQQDVAENDTERAEETLAAAVEELRHTLTHFHPASLDELGLSTALTAYAGQLARRHRAEVEVRVDAPTGPDAAILYAVGRELLANSAKHARARHIELSVEVTESNVRLQVTDDGKGFDPAAPTVAGHIGLATVRRHVSARDGRLEISSSPGQGTTVTVDLPRDRAITGR
jgi:signal transduction histidine kinase